MKKLFLYVLLFITIFFAAFELFYAYFLHQKWKTEDGLSDTEITATEASLEAAETMQRNAYTGYYLTITDDIVTAYLGDKSTVYEYTDLDANVIRQLDVKLYEELQNGLYFDTRERLFDFLESIVS